MANTFTSAVSTKQNVQVSRDSNNNPVITGDSATAITTVVGTPWLSPQQFNIDLTGATDSTAQMQAWIDSAPEWSVLQLPALSVVRIDGSLSHNKNGLIIAGPPMSQHAKTSAPRLMVGGAGGLPYFLKMGNESNYAAGNDTTNLRTGCGLRDLMIHGQSKGFTDAAVVAVGIQSMQLDNVTARFVGAYGGSGNPNKARFLRLRCVWDSRWNRIKMLDCHNPGAEQIYVDSFIGDTNGNTNNIIMTEVHRESCSGSFLRSAADSNLDTFTVRDSKFESGSIWPSQTGTYVFDLAFGNRIRVRDNVFNLFNLDGLTEGLIKLESGVGLSWSENKYANCTGNEYNLGPSATLADIRGNVNMSNVTRMTSVNRSTRPHRIEKPVSELGAGGWGLSKDIVGYYGPWIPVHRLSPNDATMFVPDAYSVSNEKSVLRIYSDSSGTVPAVGIPIVGIPTELVGDFGSDIQISVKARRLSASGTAALRLFTKSGVYTAFSAFSTLPTAKTGVTFTGTGSVATATFTAHGFQIGDAVLISGASVSGYNTATYTPVFITSVTANTFTFASAATGAATGGSVQYLPWQTLSLVLPASAFSAIGRDPADRFRVEYGNSNDQPIDIDAVAVTNVGAFSSSYQISNAPVTASVTLVGGTDSYTQFFNGTSLTANITRTLDATNSRRGSKFRFVLTTLAATTSNYNVAVQNVYDPVANSYTATRTLVAGQWFEVEHNGTGFVVTAFGDLPNQNNVQTVSSSAGAIALNLATNRVFRTTLSENVTAITPTNATDGRKYTWFLTQNGTGGFTVTWPAAFRWAGTGATAPTFTSTAAAARYKLELTYDATLAIYYAEMTQGY